MKQLKRFLLVTLAVLLTTGLQVAVKADDEQYSLNIIKYSLTEAQLKDYHLPQTPVGTAVQADYHPLANAKYQIDKVVPSNDSQHPFDLAPDNVRQTLATDSQGKLTLSLPAGLYRVTELVGPGLPKAAPPVIVQLPLTLENGQVIKEVYIYPKPSPLTPEVPETPGYSPPKKIPNTAGNIPSIQPVYWMLGTVLVFGSLGLFALKRRKV